MGSCAAAVRFAAVHLAVAALSALGAVGALSAQGTVNPTLLQASPDENASPLRRAGLAGIVAAVRGGVVWVAVEVEGNRGSFVIERASSGVVVDASGLVVTWGRLVREAVGAADKKLVVQLDDAENTRLDATVVRVDDATGLALLRVVPPAGGLAAATLGADRPAAGTPLVVVARPFGKEMLAFGGLVSPAIAGVQLAGAPVAPGDIFLTDSRNDERCDGAPVFDGQGRLLGLYDSTYVQRDKSEPTLEELRRPSFGIAVPAGRLRAAFATEFRGLANASLAQEPPGAKVHAWSLAVQKAAPAVVSVWAGGGDWPDLGALDPGGVVRREDLGSGTIVSSTGLVIANAHVCRQGEPRVRLLDGRTFAAKVLATDRSTNLALLQLDVPAGTELPVAEANVDDDALLGETVLALGNPLGIGVVVAGGVVSARRGNLGGRLQSDASLGAQNGGGAIVDVNGRLLGIGDAGPVDQLEQQFARRNDRITVDTNLSTFVAIGAARRAFAKELEQHAADAPFRTGTAASEADKLARTSSLTAMVQRASGAMLNVYVERNLAVQKEDDPFPPEPRWLPFSLGSGVIVDKSGLAISNWHVVDDATNADGSMVADHRVKVRVFGGKEYEVEVLSISREDDLSLLRLRLDPGEEVQAVEFGSSEALAIGEAVAAIGNPHGRANTITYGVVTAKEQKLKVRGRFRDLEPLLETDAAINGGNSGGALLDMNGRLVGINSAGGGTFNNKGYAIEVDHVRKQVLGLLFAAYKLRSPDLGLRVVDEDGKVLVLDTDPRGPAAKAGVKSGDRITAIDDVAITWSPGFALTLLQRSPGQPLTLHLERGGTPRQVQVAPLPAAVWAVVRQSGLLVRDFAYAEDPERVRAASIALHRQFTGDAAGEPSVIPANVVAVETVYAGEQPDGADVQPGDLLLAVELVRGDGRVPVLVRLADVAALRDLWNDRHLGTYEGSTWNVWIARGAEVRRVELSSKRLFW